MSHIQRNQLWFELKINSIKVDHYNAHGYTSYDINFNKMYNWERNKNKTLQIIFFPQIPYIGRKKKS